MITVLTKTFILYINSSHIPCRSLDGISNCAIPHSKCTAITMINQMDGHEGDSN